MTSHRCFISEPQFATAERLAASFVNWHDVGRGFINPLDVITAADFSRITANSLVDALRSRS